MGGRQRAVGENEIYLVPVYILLMFILGTNKHALNTHKYPWSTTTETGQ